MTEPFALIVADPPWRFGDRLPGKTRGAAKHYPTLTVRELCAFRPFHFAPVANNALLVMWRVSAMVEEAYQVVRAWGFTPKSELVWEKTTPTGKPHFGMGHYVRASHETAIIAVRGRWKPLVRNVRSRFSAPVGRHSEKPESFYQLIETFAAGPRLELFARREREGWTCLGNEVSRQEVDQ
jgi:site-specific DNA-methyltransferase (adenine-specific)